MIADIEGTRCASHPNCIRQ